MWKKSIDDLSKLDAIIKTIEEVTNTNIITAYTRHKYYADLRRIYGHLAKDLTCLSLSEIGRHIKRDHATIIHYIKTTNDLLEYDKDFKRLYHKIKDRLEVDMPYIVLEQSYLYHYTMADKYKKQLDDKKNAEV